MNEVSFNQVSQSQAYILFYVREESDETTEHMQLFGSAQSTSSSSCDSSKSVCDFHSDGLTDLPLGTENLSECESTITSTTGSDSNTDAKTSSEVFAENIDPDEEVGLLHGYVSN